LRNFLTPVKVGLLVVLGVVSFFIFFGLIRDRVESGDTVEYWAAFSDASGLEPKSEVRIAGVTVGFISGIELVEGKARVFLSVPERFPIFPDAVVRKRSSSILGDSLIDLSPGAPAQPGQQPLPPGSEIRNVRESLSADQLFDTLGEVAADIQSMTQAVRELVEGERGTIQEIVRNIASASETLDETIGRSSVQLDQVLQNAEAITSRVRGLTEAHSGDVSEIITNVRVISEQAREVVASIREVIGANEGALAEGAEGIQGSLANLNKTLANLESITARIDRGEGAVGKLVSDKELGDRVGHAIENTTDYMERVQSLQVELLLRSEYLFRAAAAKTYVGIAVAPTPDKYFQFEVVDDPLGYESRETVIRTPPGQEQAANQEVRRTTDLLKFSAIFAKRYSFATFRFGLIESTGGAGMDLHFLGDHLLLRMDLFDFGNPETTFPRLRVYAQLRFLRHIFVTGGMDDLANRAAYEPGTGRLRAGRDPFVGGGIVFTDEDLKVIFGASGLVP